MYHIVVNPVSCSGRGKLYWAAAEPLLKEKNISYKVYISKHHGHISQIIKEITSSTAEDIQIIVFGGDGTINEAIQGITSFEHVSLSYVPTGSSNDLARDLGISLNPKEALLHLLEHPISVQMDVGTLHCENSLVRDGHMTIPDRRFLVSCGIGYDAAICKEALSSPIKNFLNRCGLGKLTYLGIALKQLISTKYITGELTLEENETIIPIRKLLFIAGMNHRYEGGGFMFGPDADNHDGIIDICSVTRISKFKILTVLPSAFKGKHYRYEGVDGYKANNYTIRTSIPLWVHTDGEVETKADFISVKCNPRQLRFIF